MHRDLKPENILVVDDYIVKITDFGLAKQLTGDGLAKTFCGTPQYFAPEVFLRQHTVAGQGRYTGPAADCWSLGVVLYVLLSGLPPFDNSSTDWELDFSRGVWDSVSNAAKDLISKLLCQDATQRISAMDACSHEWILTDDGDTHTHPLQDPLLVTVKEDVLVSEAPSENNGNDPNNTTDTLSLAKNATQLTNIAASTERAAPTLATDEDDEVLSDFSNDEDKTVETSKKDKILIESNHSKNSATFWHPEKLMKNQRGFEHEDKVEI